MRLKLALTIIAAALTACATPPPPLGTPADQVLQTRGMPTARYAMPDSGERLEYATGPYGRETWMIDIDASRRVVAARQVLNEAEFLKVQSATDLTADEMLRWIGTPGDRRGGGRQGGQVWTWRYPTNDCLWFHASVTDEGRVWGASYGIDWSCDAPSDRAR